MTESIVPVNGKVLRRRKRSATTRASGGRCRRRSPRTERYRTASARPPRWHAPPPSTESVSSHVRSWSPEERSTTTSSAPRRPSHRPTPRAGGQASVVVLQEVESAVFDVEHVAGLLAAVGHDHALVARPERPVDDDLEGAPGDQLLDATARASVYPPDGDRTPQRALPRRSPEYSGGALVEGEHLVRPGGLLPGVDQLGDPFGVLVGEVVDCVGSSAMSKRCQWSSLNGFSGRGT